MQVFEYLIGKVPTSQSDECKKNISMLMKHTQISINKKEIYTRKNKTDAK
jgi:hypothetical protein